MKNIKLLSLLLFGYVAANAQVTVTTGQTPAQLVQNVLVGTGVTVSNVNFVTDANQQIGFFNGVNSNIGIPAGVILSTGRVQDAGNATSGVNASTPLTAPGDIDLEDLTNNTTNDAAVLTFQFVPTNDTVQFNYVFASEEYPEFVNSSFNDVFGFFISGPNPGGGNYNALNIATLPSGQPVTIDNVNATTNSAFYVANNNVGNNTVVYDGFTVKLTALARVVPCSTYTIKIGVADVGDLAYDSAVFLEAGSFTSNDAFNFVGGLVSGVNDTLAIEPCLDAQFVVQRNTNFGVPTQATLIIGGTATSGVDYVPIPTTINFGPTDTSVTVTVDALIDNLPEGIETVTISLPTTNVCGTNNLQTITILIKDRDTLQAFISPIAPVANGCSPITLNASALGGAAPYLFTWAPGVTGAALTITPTTDTIVNVLVTDQCSSLPDTAQVAITIVPPQPLQTSIFSNQGGLCANLYDLDGFSTFGGVPGYSFAWTSDQTGGTVLDTNAFFQVAPTVPTTYTLTVTDLCGETATAQITLQPNQVIPVNIITQFADTTISCAQAIDLNALASGGVGSPYTYTWQPGNQSGASITVSPTSSTTYFVFATDQCLTPSDTLAVQVTVAPPPPVFVSLATDTNVVFCGEDALVVASVNGGTPTFTYAWNTGATTPNVTVPITQDTTLIVTVSDACNQVNVDTLTILQGIYPLIVTLPSFTDTTVCLPAVQASASATGGSGNYSYLWSNGDSAATTVLAVDTTALQTLHWVVAFDECGSPIDTVQLVINLECPVIDYNVFTPNGDGTNDLLVFSNLLQYDNARLKVFNRWGTLVYEDENYKNTWNGDGASEGVYFYILTIDDPATELHGSVTILR